MTDENKTGCELGRKNLLRIEILEKGYVKLEKEVTVMHKEILDRLNTWIPKPAALVFSAAVGIIAALITAIAMLLTR